MRNYLVLTPVRGLPRADQSREPINAGEVVALPSVKATELGVIGAVEPSEAEETILLVWPDLIGTVTPMSADRDGLVAAIGELGGIVFFVGDGLPDRAEEVLADFSNDQLLHEIAMRIDEARLSPILLNGIVDIATDAPVATGSVGGLKVDGQATVETPQAAKAAEAPIIDDAPVDPPKPEDVPQPVKAPRKKAAAK